MTNRAGSTVFTARERLFHDLNAKLTKLDASLGSDIACPICFRRFGLDSLKVEKMSEDHVPPKAVSRLIGEECLHTLVCTRCNNTAGSRLQNDLKQFIRAQLHAYGKYSDPLPGTMTIEGGLPMQCNITWTPGQVLIKGVRKANNPSTIKQHLSAFEAYSHGQASNLKFDMTINYGCKLAKARSAYLHTAYLAAFILTECSYPFTKAGAQLRILPATGETHLLGPCLIEPQVVGVGGKPWIAAITQPAELRCIWVKVAGNIVILPDAGDDELLCYKEWQRVCQDTPFGLKPQGVAFRANFLRKEDAVEAAKCLPRVFANLPATVNNATPK